MIGRHVVLFAQLGPAVATFGELAIMGVAAGPQPAGFPGRLLSAAFGPSVLVGYLLGLVPCLIVGLSVGVLRGLLRRSLALYPLALAIGAAAPFAAYGWFAWEWRIGIAVVLSPGVAVSALVCTLVARRLWPGPASEDAR